MSSLYPRYDAFSTITSKPTRTQQRRLNKAIRDNAKQKQDFLIVPPAHLQKLNRILAVSDTARFNTTKPNLFAITPYKTPQMFLHEREKQTQFHNASLLLQSPRRVLPNGKMEYLF